MKVFLVYNGSIVEELSKKGASVPFQIGNEVFLHELTALCNKYRVAIAIDTLWDGLPAGVTVIGFQAIQRGAALKNTERIVPVFNQANLN